MSTLTINHEAGAKAAYDAFAPYYDRFTATYDYERWTRALEDLARAHGLAGDRLLDVACGTGKSFAPFAGRGYAVTACDISEAMVERARARNADARLLVRDVRGLDHLGEFDLITCLGDGLNYLTSQADLHAAFEGVRRNLAPSGRFVFDLNTLWCYRTFFRAIEVIQDADLVLIWHGHADPDISNGGLAEATLSAYCRKKEAGWELSETHHVQRHHPSDLVARCLAAAGLAPLAVFGQDVSGSMFGELDDQRDSKAIYIARIAGAPSNERR